MVARHPGEGVVRWQAETATANNQNQRAEPRRTQRREQQAATWQYRKAGGAKNKAEQSAARGR